MTDKIVRTKNKGECLALETNDLTAILDMTITSIKASKGRPSEYPDTHEGLEAFRQQTLEFFEHVNRINANPEIEKKLVPDIEAWAVYLGITRQTIHVYEKRSAEWRDTILVFKNAIASCKKQLAMTYKVPPMIAVFDLVNNHGYVNSNEFHLIPEKPRLNDNDREEIRLNLQKRLDESGLVWDADKGEYVTKDMIDE